MDEDQAHKLGDKMKEVYADVVHDTGTEVSTRPNQASRKLQKKFKSGRAARGGAGTLEAQVVSFVKERPIVALIAAAGVGYLLSRLAARD